MNFAKRWLNGESRCLFMKCANSSVSYVESCGPSSIISTSSRRSEKQLTIYSQMVAQGTGDWGACASSATCSRTNTAPWWLLEGGEEEREGEHRGRGDRESKGRKQQRGTNAKDWVKYFYEPRSIPTAPTCCLARLITLATMWGHHRYDSSSAFTSGHLTGNVFLWDESQDELGCGSYARYVFLDVLPLQ